MIQYKRSAQRLVDCTVSHHCRRNYRPGNSARLQEAIPGQMLQNRDGTSIVHATTRTGMDVSGDHNIDFSKHEKVLDGLLDWEAFGGYSVLEIRVVPRLINQRRCFGGVRASELTGQSCGVPGEW